MNSETTAGRTLPWLQDTDAAAVWNSLEIEYRDVLILDDENHPVALFNLSSQDLADSTHYDSLMTLLLEISDTLAVIDDSSSGAPGEGDSTATGDTTVVGDSTATGDTTVVGDSTATGDTTVVGDSTDTIDSLAMADFSAPDVNRNSARYNEQVSPRDYKGQLSAWYFGHST